MRVKILGPGCPRCNYVEETTRKALIDLAISADIEHVRDIEKIREYHAIKLPGLVINEKVVWAGGRVPAKSEIAQFIRNSLNKEQQGS
jgi:small redox-active disulfide protein 2